MGVGSDLPGETYYGRLGLEKAREERWEFHAPGSMKMLHVMSFSGPADQGPVERVGRHGCVLAGPESLRADMAKLAAEIEGEGCASL